MRRLLAMCLLLCALCVPVSAGIIHQPGEPAAPTWMETDSANWIWDFANAFWYAID